MISGNEVSDPFAVSDCCVVPVSTVNNDEDSSVNITAIVALLYALSTLNVVPENAESVANEPVPDAGDTAEESSVLNAIPRTSLELSAAVVPAAPTVNSSTVLNVPELDKDQLKLAGLSPNADNA